MFDIDSLFYKSELIPVIVQDIRTRQVLMVGFANREAVRKTLETGTAWFWSRSRQTLWNKGETSGNYLYVKEVYTDCDTDTLLLLAVPAGPACHTGAVSCFFHDLTGELKTAPEEPSVPALGDHVLEDLYQVVLDRKQSPMEGSYTCYLFEKGLDKILKKVGEESAETIIAAKNDVASDTVGEISDLIYHLMVMMAEKEIPLQDVLAELDRRSQKIGNLKTMHVSDHET